MYRSAQLLAFLLILHSSSTAAAQGYRVSTMVYDLAHSSGELSAPVVSGSLTLFHNGRVYDYVDQADEIIIYQPAESRFLILNPARGMRTVLTDAEIRHLTEQRHQTTKEYIADLPQTGAAGQRSAAMLAFQLDPEFRVEESGDTISLHSPRWVYRAKCQSWDDTTQVRTYYNYADRIAQVNSLLHPTSMFPEPRIKLNAELLTRRPNCMPVEIELDLRPADALRYRAVHQFRRGLDELDRKLIDRWEQLSTADSVRDVAFRNYQESVRKLTQR